MLIEPLDYEARGYRNRVIDNGDIILITSDKRCNRKPSFSMTLPHDCVSDSIKIRRIIYIHPAVSGRSPGYLARNIELQSDLRGASFFRSRIVIWYLATDNFNSCENCRARVTKRVPGYHAGLLVGLVISVCDRRSGLIFFLTTSWRLSHPSHILSTSCDFLYHAKCLETLCIALAFETNKVLSLKRTSCRRKVTWSIKRARFSAQSADSFLLLRDLVLPEFGSDQKEKRRREDSWRSF